MKARLSRLALLSELAYPWLVAGAIALASVRYAQGRLLPTPIEVAHESKD